MKWKNKKQEINLFLLKYIEVILIVIVILIAIPVYLYKSNQERKLKKDYQYTIGYILKWGSNVDESTTIKYSFQVDNVIYERGFVNPSVTLERKDKYFNKIDCTNIKFWVIYSPDDPSFSLINLREEITDTLNAKFPSSLDDFE